MNAKSLPIPLIKAACCLALVLCAKTSLAFDPLFTLPLVIDKGATLPGDTSLISCPVQKNYLLPLALGDAVDLALCNNPQVRAAWANIKFEAGAVGEARAAYLPTLSGSLSRINDSTVVVGNAASSSSVKSNTIYESLTWRLFDFGGRAANQKMAESLLSAALANHDAALQKTLTAVVQAYFDGLTARATFIAKKKSEEIAQNTLASAQRRESHGVTTQSDTLQATTALAKATLEKNRADGAYQKALSLLVYSLGIPSSTTLLLPEELLQGPAETVAELNQLLADAQQNHPAIIAARAQLDAARSNVTVTRSQYLPTVDFTGNYYQNGRPGQQLSSTRTKETTIGVVLTIPLFDGFSSHYKVAGAEAQVEEKEATLADTENQTLMDVVKAHADAVSAQGNLQAADILLDAAQHALAVSRRKYEKGAADILEILNTQNALADAEQEHIHCLADWRSARLRLLSSVGTIGRTAIEGN